MDTKRKALCLLLKKKETGSTVNFDAHLEINIKSACEILQLEYYNLTKICNSELYYNEKSCENVRWKFICLSFHILFSLKDADCELYSVNLLTGIKNVLQFIVSFGILPNLIRGIGIDMNIRFKSADQLPLEEINTKDKYYRLRLTTNALLKCLNIDRLRNYILENHFNDILSALLQLTSAPLKKLEDFKDDLGKDFYYMVLKDREFYKMELENILINVHPPLVTRELMFHHGNKKSPIWLRNIVYKILNERILLKNGVESLIRALFDSEAKDVGIDWKYWDVLTKLLMTNPEFDSDEVYFDNVCKQLFDLLNKRSYDKKRIENYEIAFVKCTKYLYETNNNICETNIITPLLNFLLKYCEGSIIISSRQRSVKILEIEQNISLLYSCFVDSSINLQTIPIRFIKPIIIILFNLFYTVHKTCNIQLTENISDILLKYLDECCDKDKYKLFENFIFETEVADIKQDFYFSLVNDEIKIIDEKNFDSFLRSDSFINLLQRKNTENLTISFFIYLLEIFTNIYGNDEKVTENTKQKLITYKLLSQLLEDSVVLKNLKPNLSKLLLFTENVLKLILDKNIHKNTDYDSEQFQILFILIMVVNTVIKNSETKGILKDFNILLNVLKKISLETCSTEIKELVNEILEESSSETTKEKNKTDFERAIDDICSPLISIQGHGLHMLVKLIEENDPETLGRKQYILNIFKQNLKSKETFIYLRAINGLATLANSFPSTILDTLTDEYLNPREMTEKDIEFRLKTGEILIRITSALGDMAPKYKADLLTTFLAGTRDSDSLIRASSFSNLGEVCKVLGYKLGTIITEILSCIHDCIQFELQIEVRRASITVVRQLFVGLQAEMISFLKEDILPLYRTLKSVYMNDSDSVTRLQAQLALEELNEIMKSYLNPEINMFPRIIIK